MGMLDRFTRKISRTWSLMGASWDVLKKDKEMLIFPLVSGICCLLVLASFALPLSSSGAWRTVLEAETFNDQVVSYVVIFLFYLVTYFIIIFFNSAVVACAASRMEGHNPTLADGFRMAFSRLPLIFGWAVVSATVGLLLSIIEDRFEKAGELVSNLIGLGWTVVTYLVVPVLVFERLGPIAALRRSAALLKETWGEQLIGSVSFGLLFFLFSLPGVLVLLVITFTGELSLIIPAGILVVLYFIFLALVQSTLQTIFKAALYYNARKGKIPGEFQSAL